MVRERVVEGESTRRNIVVRLRELITALDRRIPRIERAEEHRIATESALLKKEAQERITELESTAR
jgi:hypothetical protein